MLEGSNFSPFLSKLRLDFRIRRTRLPNARGNVSESQRHRTRSMLARIRIDPAAEITRALRAGKPGPHYCRRKRYFYWRQKRIARHRSFHVRCFIGPMGVRRSFFSLAFPSQRNTLSGRAHARARDFCKINDPSGGDIPDKSESTVYRFEIGAFPVTVLNSELTHHKSRKDRLDDFSCHFKWTFRRLQKNQRVFARRCNLFTAVYALFNSTPRILNFVSLY